MALTFTFLKKTKWYRLLLVLLFITGSWQATNAQCSWVASTVYPVPTLDMPVATVGGFMYSFAGVSNGAIVASSNKFDGTTWTSIAPTPQGLEFASAVSDGTNIYVLGGASTTGVPQSTNYRYNVATNTYTTMAPFTTGTWNQAAVFLNGKIYKFAGSAAAGSTTALEIYNIGTNTWSAGAAYPAALSFVSGATDGTYIYAGGGIASVGSLASSKTYRYDPGTNTWDDVAIADLPATRWGAAGDFYNGRFIMAGGYVGGTVTANISTSALEYIPAVGVWNAIPNLLSDAARTTGTVYNGSFYVVGGRSQASAGFVGTTANQKLTCPPVVCVPTNATAPIVSGPSSTCTGSSATLNVVAGALNGANQWRWYTGSCGGTLVGTGTSITVTPAATTTYFVRGEGGCAPAPGPCSQVTVTVAPCTCIAPTSATICAGAIQKLTVVGTGTPGTATVSSGPIAVIVPDANAAGIATTLPVALPAGAAITSMTVTINMTHTWDADMVFNLKGPNGTQVLNLINSVGGSGDNFTNTTITSVAGSPLISTGTPPFTGTYAPSAANAVGPTAFVSNVNTFTALFANAPNGNWTLAMRDLAGGDIGTLTSWSMTINYTVLPTATWTGPAGTIFSDALASTAYVAGTQANAVWVKPTAIGTNTYTATIASGPCAGANNVTVTVLPLPIVAVSPATSCGPSTLTATGADFYTWSPSAGLNTSTGATVTANPNVTTTYTVTGTSNNSCQATATAVVNSAPTASVISAISSPVFQIQQGFTTVPVAGWAVQNNSSPLGTTTWFQGNPAVFPAFNGAPNSYIAANWQNTTTAGPGDISDWLMTSVLNIKTGDQISFYSRTTTGATFPDRLEVRLSTAGASLNVGSTTTSVGDFTTLLLTINPNLQPGPANYPDTWTRFTATITGITGTVSGRIGFRYWVPNGGGGANSDYIGIDQVEYTSPPAPLCANTVTNIAVNITGGVGPYTVVFSNGTTNTTITNYTSGGLIQVSPAVTTTYTIVSVTGANGCVGTGNSGSAVVVITPPPSITTQPVNTSVCSGNNATLTVAAGPTLGNTYQWQVSTDNGVTYTNVVNAGVYSGATSPSLVITGATVAMNNYLYRVLVTGSCAPAVTSNAITLSVNIPAVITTQPVNTSVCVSGGLASTTTTFSVVATGGGLTYQWQVSTDGGTTWTNITNGGSYAGATSATLTLSGVPVTFTNNRYRVIVTTGGCTGVTSASATLTANPNPVIVLSANPYTRLYPGLTTTLTAATSPAGTYTYTWFRNGIVVPGATGNTLVVNVDQLGAYSVIATNSGTTCRSQSSTVNIADSITGNIFIYPSPNQGRFQVRYINPPGTSVVRMINIYDAKGSRVYSRSYGLNAPYSGRLDVDIRNMGRGIYLVELTDGNGNRIKAGYSLVL